MKWHAALIGLLAIMCLMLWSTNAIKVLEDQLVHENNMILKVIKRDEMNKLLELYPNAVEMNTTKAKVPKGRSLYPQGRNTITYTLGTGRVSGDKLVASDSSTNSFDVPTTLSAKIRYPSSGTGAIVTYVKINVYQSNDNGRAYVTSGGIGSNYIVVVVEAEKTYYFDTIASVYGK